MNSILIIEDDPKLRKVMAMVLEKEGFDVRCSPDGESGLLMILDNRPDLILCDIIMPEMDGYEVLDIVRNEKKFCDIPFVFISALGDRKDVRKGMFEGADDYLPKPCTTEELVNTVTARIRHHELIRESSTSTPVEKESLALLGTITKREREVLKLVGSGASSKKIADQLGISLKTAEAHRSNLMSKLDAVNAAALTRWAIAAEQSGFFDP